jgi:phosphate:Na+ symporter
VLLLRVLEIIGSLGVFLYGMKVMSDGLQKSAGQGLQKVLNFMTSNRFFGVFTGFLITSIIQSSSATTVMVVSFVNAGLISLQQAVGTIMGANIGTTITTWIVSYLGFKVDMAILSVPIIGLGLPMMFAKRKRIRDISDFVIGFGLLFMGIGLLKTCVPDVSQHPEMLQFICKFSQHGVWSYLLFVLAGTAITAIVQSSSAMMTVTVAMAFKGWLDLPSAAALCLGENIGTTITANLASIGTTVSARRAARVHTLFNVFGVVWISFVFHPVINLLSIVAPWDFYARGNFPLNLALFHSFFNISNTLIMLPFTGFLANTATKWVKPSARDVSKEYRLPYINTRMQDAPQLNILEAKKEVQKMAELTSTMFEKVIHLFHHPNEALGETVEHLRDSERLSDQMQEEITKFLLACSKENLSEESIKQINVMIRVLHELEGVADSCFNICLLAQRRHEKKISLPEEAEKELHTLISKVRSFIAVYREHMPEAITRAQLDSAIDLERDIDESRRRLFRSSRKRMQEGSDVRGELVDLDIIRYLEHIGDSALNIMQALHMIRSEE